MRYFHKMGVNALSLIIFTFFSVLLLPAFSSAANLTVAVVPWNVNAPEELSYLQGALTDMLSSRVGSNDKVEIIRKDLTAKAAGKYDLKNIGGKEAVKLGRELKADFLLYGSLSVLGDSISLDAKILNISTGEITTFYSTGIGLASITKMTRTIANDASARIRSQGASIKPDLSYTGKFRTKESEADNVIKVKAEISPGAILDEKAATVIGDENAEQVVVITRKTGGKTLKRRSSNIDGFFVSMTRADLDGDGVDEIFMASKDKLLVASFGIEGLKIIKEFNFPIEVQNLFLSSGDTDKDGKDEVYLASLVRGEPKSQSVKYHKGSYIISSTGLNYLLRAIEVEGEGTVLLAQKFKSKSGFFRKIIKIKKDGENYSKNGKLNLPKSVARSGISNFQFIDIDKDGTNEIITLGKRGNLMIYKAGESGRFKEFWRSPDTYGGSLNELEKAEPIGDESSLTDETFYMASEIKYGDFDSDGVNEIMVINNLAGGMGKFAKKVLYYKSGTIQRLYWNVAIFEQEWKTRDISGYIADFIISDLDNDGTREVTMLVVDNMGSLLKKDKMHSYLLSYSIR